MYDDQRVYGIQILKHSYLLTIIPTPLIHPAFILRLWLDSNPITAASHNCLNLPLTRSTTSLLERLIRAIPSVNIPIHFSIATRLTALFLPYVAVVPELRLVPSLLLHSSERFLSTEVLPYARTLHPFGQVALY